MKDIKKLYLAAKQSGKKHDVDAYSECVREYLESHPFQYVSNLEYIISSSIGLSTLREFVDRNGISIGSYNEIMSCLNEGVKQCKLRSKNYKPYQEAVAMMESYKHQYQNCFIMFEAFQDRLDDRYTEAYYKNFPILKGALAGQVNVARIISRFGESCVPDMLIYASKFGNPDVMLESLRSAYEQSFFDNIPVSYQWISESVKDIPETSSTIVESINVKSLGRIVESARNRNTALYRESVLTGDDNIMQQYTESELNAMEDLITFKEYQITCLENVDQIMDLQQQIYSLYEAFDGLIEEDVATSVAPMLPGSQQKVTTNLAEASLGNTTNKKTGDIPDYLKRNHDISYGEEDPVKKPEEKTNDNNEPSLDDFKRPSAEEDHTKITPYDYSQDDNKSADVKSDGEEGSDDKKQHVNNHYYYTYTNSNNTNSNSFNRHNQDDHSTGKRINSADNINARHQEAFEESFVAAAIAGAIFIAPIILIGGAIYGIYTLHKYNKKCEERINSVISGILGGVEITSPEKYIRAAGKHFENHIDDNEDKIAKLLYRSDVASSKPGRIRAYIAITNKGKREEDYTADGIARMINEDTLLFTSNDVITGVIKRDDLEEKFDSLNDNSYVKVTATELTDFPTNRYSDGWKYLKKAGLITLTPTSGELNSKREDGTDNEGKSNVILKQMMEDLSKARDKYAVVQISFIMPVKDFLLNDFPRGGGVKTESAFWSIDDLQAQPLTELYHLPADYYNLYHEATSVLVTEANALAVELRDPPKEKEEEKPGVLAKIKAMMMKFINFLIEAYERLFPKGFRAFSKLENKFKKSEKLMNACKRNDNILKIMDLKIPHVSGVTHAFHDLVQYVNSGKIPTKGMEMYQRPGVTQIAIYWGALTGKDGKGDASVDHMCFRLASDTPTSTPKSPNLGKNLARISTYLSEDNLLEAFGIRVNNHRGARMRIDDIINVLKYTKAKINTSVDLWKNRDNRDKMLELLKALTDVTNNVYRTMNQAYKSAVLLLRNAEEGKFESANLWLESSAPWELNVFPRMDLFQEMGSPAEYFREASVLGSAMYEDVGDADDQKPSSDNPIQDTMTDLDRKLASTQQTMKKKVQGVVNTTRTIVKPFKRTAMWISNMVSNWKDANENDIKERLADPHQRSNLMTALKTAIKYGSLYKAGLLLNPIILYLTLSKRWNRSSKEFRLRNEMIGELKAELEIITVKIQDADRAGDNKSKYQLMRFKNELNKKLIRVSGTEVMAKMV